MVKLRNEFKEWCSVNKEAIIECIELIFDLAVFALKFSVFIFFISIATYFIECSSIDICGGSCSPSWNHFIVHFVGLGIGFGFILGLAEIDSYFRYMGVWKMQQNGDNPSLPQMLHRLIIG